MGWTHRAVMGGLVGTAGLALLWSTYARADEDPCAGLSTAVVVETNDARLSLCKDGRRLGEYDVSFGSNGVGKTRPNDKKTPIGTYALTPPRRSFGGYHVFIGIQVPKRIGTAVGVHGPRKGFRWLGAINGWFNWTQGCIAVAYVSEIEAIARFVRRHPKAKIHILPPSD